MANNIKSLYMSSKLVIGTKMNITVKKVKATIDIPANLIIDKTFG